MKTKTRGYEMWLLEVFFECFINLLYIVQIWKRLKVADAMLR